MTFLRFVLTLSLTIAFMTLGGPTRAQGSDLAAILEVLEGAVEVNRVNTEQWIAVQVEAIVGVGDRVRTGSTGKARITFFADGIEADMEPGTEMRIGAFNGNAESFNLNFEVLVGQTAQRISRALDASSSYVVTTPGMTLAARGTEFEVRVESNGRAAMLVRESTVEANSGGAATPVETGYGIRGQNGALSDVVQAESFAELDAALDGCSAALTTPDDVSLNIRLAPSLEAARIGTIPASEVTTLFGAVDGTDWFRIAFRGGYGWVLSSTAEVASPCAGLRTFAADFAGEDPTQYSSLGEVIDINALPVPGS